MISRKQPSASFPSVACARLPRQESGPPSRTGSDGLGHLAFLPIIWPAKNLQEDCDHLRIEQRSRWPKFLRGRRQFGPNSDSAIQKSEPCECQPIRESCLRSVVANSGHYAHRASFVRAVWRAKTPEESPEPPWIARSPHWPMFLRAHPRWGRTNSLAIFQCETCEDQPNLEFVLPSEEADFGSFAAPVSLPRAWPATNRREGHEDQRSGPYRHSPTFRREPPQFDRISSSAICRSARSAYPPMPKPDSWVSGGRAAGFGTPRRSSSNCASEDPPGKATKPQPQYRVKPDHVSSGADSTRPELSRGHSVLRSRCAVRPRQNHLLRQRPRHRVPQPPRKFPHLPAGDAVNLPADAFEHRRVF